MEEEWKDITGFEGSYQVSNFGRVKSLDRYDSYGRFIHGKFLALALNSKKCGHLKATLLKNNKTTKTLVHRLVWEAFNGKIQDGYIIHHINEDPSDNRLTNLRMMTSKEHNKMHCTEAWERGIMVEAKKKGVETMKKNGGFERGANTRRKNGVYERQAIYNKKRWSKKLVQVKPDGAVVFWDSIADANKNGYTQSAVSQCCNGKYHERQNNHTYKGSEWFWLSDYDAQKEERQELETLASS